MHIYSQEKFPNLLPKISFNSDEIKSMITPYKLVFLPERNNEVEWKLKLPMFVDAFYSYVIENQSIPNQQLFFEYYIRYNYEFFTKLNRSDLNSGIRARAYRTYPSLVRDIYFNKYIEEKLCTRCNIIYNTKLDIEEGIDLMIITSKSNYAISFFTKTKNAYIGRAVKVNRHTLFSNVRYIEMPIDFKGSLSVGDFFLYGEKEYKELYKELSK